MAQVDETAGELLADASNTQLLAGMAQMHLDSTCVPIAGETRHYLRQQNALCKLIDHGQGSYGHEFMHCLDESTGTVRRQSHQSHALRMIEKKLDAYPRLVNCASDYDQYYMTALERAVNTCNFEAAELLFSRGADPKHNTYTGEMPTTDTILGNEPIDTMNAFAVVNSRGEVEGRAMPGFEGLFALCDPRDPQILPELSIEWVSKYQRMTSFLKRKQAQQRLRMLRHAFIMRNVVMYWLEKAMESSCALDGPGRLRDRAAFEAEMV